MSGKGALQKREQLRSLYWAQIHIGEAMSICEMILGTTEIASEPLWHGLSTGIVVSYCRSFGENQGLSKIGTECSRFENARFTVLHQMLIEARDKIYAHKDRIWEQSRVKAFLGATTGQEIEQFTLRVHGDGTTEWSVNRPSLPNSASFVEEVRKLAEFQIERLTEASSQLVRNLCKEKIYEPGEYIFGDGFP